MDQVDARHFLDDSQHLARRLDVVALERGRRLARDLGMELHQDRHALEHLLPRSWLRKVGTDGSHLRMQTLQGGEVARVLVDRHEVAVALLTQQRHEVLANEACSAGDDDLV
jgi:hypothetical protein